MGFCKVFWGGLRKQKNSLHRALSESRGNSIIGYLNKFYLEPKKKGVRLKILISKGDVHQEKEIELL